MSRSGYSDDPENYGLYRAAVTRALNGKRGQRALRDIATALDAMTDKRLAANSFKNSDGECCTLGVLAAARGVDMADVEPQDMDEEVDRDIAGARLDIAGSMVAEVMFENDEHHWGSETPEERWSRMRAWVVARIAADQEGTVSDGV